MDNHQPSPASQDVSSGSEGARRSDFTPSPRSRLKAVAVSSDGRWVAAGGAGRRIYVWQTDRGTLAGELKHTAGRIESLAFTPDGSGIVCGTHKGCLELFARTVGS